MTTKEAAQEIREIALKFFRGNPQANREGYKEAGLVRRLEEIVAFLEHLDENYEVDGCQIVSRCHPKTLFFLQPELPRNGWALTCAEPTCRKVVLSQENTALQISPRPVAAWRVDERKEGAAPILFQACHPSAALWARRVGDEPRAPVRLTCTCGAVVGHLVPTSPNDEGR